MIEVMNKVKVYEINNEEMKKDFLIEIRNHWNSNSKINICINGEQYTVIARDLNAAIENAINVNRY